MKKRLAGMSALWAACILALSACAGAEDDTAAAIGEESHISEAGEESDASKEALTDTSESPEGTPDESPEETEPPQAEEPDPVYVEDTNRYGNLVGNLYNNGTFAFDEETNTVFFYNIYAGCIMKTSLDTGSTVALLDTLLGYMNYQDGKLYGIEVSGENDLGGLVVCDTETGESEVLREEPLNYLQKVDGELYFTDLGDNTLRRMDAEGREETLVDESVYFPVVYKNSIIFQRDSDNESLYSVSRDGGEITKLNDLHSYYPIVYRDRIYYETVDEDDVYTLRSMRLDGTDEKVLAEERVLGLNLYDGRLYYSGVDGVDRISYIELENESIGAEELDLKDSLRKALKEAYQVTELKVIGYGPIQFGNRYALFLCGASIDGVDYMDEYLYRMDTGETLVLEEFCVPEEGANPETPQGSGGNSAGNGQGSGDGTASSGAGDSQQAAVSERAAKDAEARAVAQAIADSIPEGSDLERVRAAAVTVAAYCSNATYTTADPDYSTAYGVFCKGGYTCAGSTRALGMVLECMGYSWSHANPNQWTHQWCELTMDGQAGWADGMGGIADYGACPFASGETYTAPDGTVYMTP